jgi:hypothetical protein
MPQSQARSFSPQEVHAILQAKDQAELGKIYTGFEKNYVNAVAHAYRAHSLGIPGSEKQLIAVFPASLVQSRQLYGLSEVNYPEGRKLFRDLYTNYYKITFGLAPRHTKLFHSLFAITSHYDSGVLIEDEHMFFCDLLNNVYKKAPVPYLRALIDETKYRDAGLVCAAGCVDTK